MKISQYIRKRIVELHLDEEQFCTDFQVDSLEMLPLDKVEEIARRLSVTTQFLQSPQHSKKSFPSDIRLLILDVDGVMTDGGMYFSGTGEQSKKYNTKDGMGILHLTKKNFQVGIISSGFKGEMVKHRADMLNIQHFYLGREPKLEVLKAWCEQLSLSLSQVAMIGDDVNDLEVMKRIGFSACPQDAAPVILHQADYVLTRKGGDGCIREFIEDVMGEVVLP